MAKKSAKSKGFRRQSAKKPYLSKRDIALLCVLVIAIAVGAYFLFSYDDGALKVQDGKVVTEGDNWLIVNGSNLRGGARYYKLGEVGDVEGYDREANPVLADTNVTEYAFTAQDEGASVGHISIASSHARAEALSRYAASTLADTQGCEVSEVEKVDTGTRTIYRYFYTTSPVESAEDASADGAADAEIIAAEDTAETPAGDAEAQAEPAYRKSLCAYIDAGHDSSAVFHVDSSADAAEGLPVDDVLIDAMEKAIAALKLEGDQ